METTGQEEGVPVPVVQEPIFDPVDDDSLDDFFAKKDKKGKKKKSKFITTEALAKTLEKISTGESVEEEDTKPSKKEKESGDGNKGVNNNDVEEWHEYEDESNRDYSDLKIQNFQISDKKEVEVPEPQYDEEGELIPPKEAEGPWTNRPKETTSEPAPTKRPARACEPTSELAPTTPSVYRPPHARLTGGPTSTSGIPLGSSRRRRPQETPVIHSEIDFPSLASAVQDTEQHVGFETVKSGAKSISRSQQLLQHEASKATVVTLGNQFEALRD